MANLNKHIKSDKWKWAITFIALFLIVGAIVVLFFGVDNATTTKKLIFTDYSIASIDTSTGEMSESTTKLVSDMYKIDGLVVEIDEENSEITYKLAFYDTDETFISITESQSTNFDNTNIPENAEYFRVEITPNQVEDEDVELDIFNKITYANQLTVTINK